MRNRICRTAIFLAAVLLALVPAGIAYAQAEEPEQVIYCGLLSADDCALLEASAETMRMLTSAQSEIRTELYLDGIGGFSPDEPVFAQISQLAFLAEPEVIERLAELQGMDPETLASQPDIKTELATLPLQINGSNANTYMLSSELTDMIRQSTGIDLPSEISFETRLVNGILYIHVADIAEYVPQLGTFGDWIGIDVGAIVTFSESRSDDEADADDVSEESIIELPGEGLTAAVVVEVEPGTEPLYDDFLDMIALRNAAADGQSVAVYRTKVDVADLLTSPLLTAQLQAGLADSGNTDLTPIIRIGQTLAAVFLSDLDVTIIQGIGMEVPAVYGVDSQITWQLGSADDEDPLAQRQIVLLTSARNLNMNNVTSIPAPEDAFVPPISLILGLLGNIGQ